MPKGLKGFQKGNQLGKLSIKEKIKLICKFCKKEFEVKSYRKDIAKFCSHKCKGKWQKVNCIGKQSSNWKGGKVKATGYWYIYKPEHPFADKRNYVLRSRLVAEKCLKRYLTLIEIIHHINGNSLDDRPENLYLFPSNSKHTIFHKRKIKPKLVSNLI